MWLSMMTYFLGLEKKFYISARSLPYQMFEVTIVLLSLGKHDLIVRFMEGARMMNPSRPPLFPLGTSLSSWLDFRGAP